MQRKASARWQGTAKEGAGTISTQSGTLKDTPYSFVARFGDGLGQTASFLDERVIPTAKKAADDLEASLGTMRNDGKQLAPRPR